MGLLFNRFKHLDNKRFKKTINVIQKRTGKSKLFIITDIIINTLTRGSGYTDYFRGDYINLTSKEKDTFVTIKQENNKCILRRKGIFLSDRQENTSCLQNIDKTGRFCRSG